MTSVAGTIIIIEFISNTGVEKFGIENIGAFCIGVTSTSPSGHDMRYPPIMAIRTGIAEKNFRNRTEPNTAIASVTIKTTTLRQSMAL